jgi:hypothetical protein
MEYLPDVYQHFERAFPHVHSAHQELAKACYEGGPNGSCSLLPHRARSTGPCLTHVRVAGLRCPGAPSA